MKAGNYAAAVLAVVVGAAVASDRAQGHPPAPMTCAHHLQQVGCIRRSPEASFVGGGCNVLIYGNSSWLWGQEGNSRIAHTGKVAPGNWRVVTPFGGGSVIRLRPGSGASRRQTANSPPMPTAPSGQRSL